MIPFGLNDPNVGEKPPKSRVDSAGSCRAMLYTLIDDDQIASYRRSQIQGIIDGNSPYNEQQLRELGQSDRSNVNWGHANSKIESAVIPYFDMLTSVPYYLTVKTRYGKDMGKREEWSRIITDEAHNALQRTNPTFTSQHQIAHKQIVTHGQACLYWPDGMDFRAKAIEPWALIVPRGAGVDQNDWEFCYILDDMYCEELYRYIETPEIAERGGWSVEECQQAIMDARVDEQDQRRPWEWYQRELKSNALYYSYAKSKIIKVAHFFVKEYDGSISHYIFDRLNGTEWLCEMPSRYKKFSNAFTVFLNGVGNGYYHSVRGLGQVLFKWAEANNRLLNALMDGAIWSSALMFQPTTSKEMEQLKSVQVGPLRLLPAGLNPTTINMGPNMQAAMQTAQFFQSQESDDSGSFMPSVAGGGGRKKGNKEIEIEIGEKSRLTNVRAEIYLQALDLHYQEIYRRLSNPNILEEDHGGPEALRFQKACLDRGVPAAAILDIESVTATRSIGQGSAAARLSAMKQIAELMPQLPESSRKAVVNSTIAAITGEIGKETFGIPDEVKPEGMQISIASLENNAFLSGGQTLIDPDQNHYVHLTVHMQFGGEVIKSLQGGQMDILKANTALQSSIPHILTHLKYLKEDPTRKEQFEETNEAVSELSKMADQVAKLAEQAQEQMAAQQGEQQGGQQDPRAAVAQNKIMLDRAKFQNDAQIKQAKAAHQMQLQDKKTAQRLMIDQIKMAQKYPTLNQ